MPTPCPSPSELHAFANGELPNERFEPCADHVLGCATCEQTLERLELDTNRRNPLSERLRGLPEASTDTSELVADAGRRLANALSHGPVRLGRFELREKLGEGAFGTVFRAHDPRLEREVALKVQRAGALSSTASRQRFLREAKSAAKLQHEGLVVVHETGETEDGVLYLVEELVEGTTLEKALRQSGFTPQRAAEIVARIAEALDHAHRHGVVHRDVKPGNVLLDRTGRPRVTDFGLALRDGGDSTLTQSGDVVGTPAYMSPELARGDAHQVDGRSDVFSLGAVLYELLTGVRAFPGQRRVQVLRQVLEEEPTPPRRLDDALPRQLENVCLMALQKQPARRYPSAAALAADLRRFLAGEPVVARAAGIQERTWLWCRRHPLAATSIAALSLLTLLGFWHLSAVSEDLVRGAAVESAAQYAALLEVVNDLYSSEVVARAGHHGVEATADYAARAGAIPLPATLLNVLLERVSQGASGMRGRHYSEHPFRTRAGGGPRDAFAREALAALRRAPDQPFFRFTNDARGEPVLRYATARIMQPSCVSCHNAHPDSSRRDWQVGDVRGALEIVRPLGSDRQRIQDALRATFLLAGSVAFGLLGLTMAGLGFNQWRRRTREKNP